MSGWINKSFQQRIFGTVYVPQVGDLIETRDTFSRVTRSLVLETHVGFAGKKVYHFVLDLATKEKSWKDLSGTTWRVMVKAC